MQTILTVAAIAASLLGMVYAALSRRAVPAAPRPRELTPLLWGIVLVAVVLFLCTLPTAPPFATGLTLGWGWLIGAVLGLYALAMEARNGGDAPGAARVTGALSTACLGPALVLLLFRGYPNEALLGCALGAVMVAFLAAGLARTLFAAAADIAGARDYFRGIELFAFAMVTVTAGARLGVEHFPHATPGDTAGGYWVFPVLALAVTALTPALWLHAGNERLRRWLPLLYGITAALVAVIVTAVAQARLLPALSWPSVVAGALAIGLIAVALTREESVAEDPQAIRPLGLAFGLALFMLAVMIVAFRGLHGYGQALVLLGALPIAAALYLSADRVRASLVPALGLGAVSLGVLLTLYRVFLERAGRGWTLDFQQHYDLFAVLLGAGAIFGLLAYNARGQERLHRMLTAGRWRPVLLLARQALLGAFLALTPLVLAALWGGHAIGAFLAGLIIGEAMWMLLAAWVAGEERVNVLISAPHLSCLVAVLAAVQFAPLVLALALSNTVKVVLAAGITIILVGWVLAEGIFAARRSGNE